MVTHDLDSLIRSVTESRLWARKNSRGGSHRGDARIGSPWLRSYFHGKRARARSWPAARKGNDGNACKLRLDRALHPGGDRSRLRLRLLVLRRRAGTGASEHPYRVFRLGFGPLSQGSSVSFNGLRVGEVTEISLLPEDPAPGRRRRPGRCLYPGSASIPARASNTRA